jgi:sporulation protein YlmC with PRC-barrel domain
MRVGELIGTKVEDRSGQMVGWVTDVRLVRDGPVLGTFGASYLVEGLIVTPHHRGGYFGYETGRVSGPALLRWLFTRLHRGSVFAPWEAIDAVDDELVTLRASCDELGPPAPLD